MRQPRPLAAFPTAAAVAAQGLTVDQIDPDHLNFLQHVRPDGNSYAVDLPARGASAPVTVKYEAGTPAANGEAQNAPAPSRALAGSDRVVGQEIPPADALLWYETAVMDEEYRKFWRQTRYADGLLVLQVGEDKVLRYGLDAVPVRLSDIADWAEKKRGKKVATVVSLGEDGDGVGVGKKEEIAPIRMVGPPLDPSVDPSVRDSLGRWQKKACAAPGQKVEQGQEEKGEGKGDAEKIKEVKRDEKMLNEMPAETLSIVKRDEKMLDKMPVETLSIVNRDEKMLDEMPVETLSIVNREINSSNGHDVKLQTASMCLLDRATNSSNGQDVKLQTVSGFFSVVWPTHIMERPESSFKERLLRVLRKPFCMEEYNDLLHVANDRLPATKKRQTRRGVKYYNSEHETNQSYFDSQPDLEKQVRSSSYPNQLALLRGFFFWLENVTNDDQFRPWRDDFRQYSIVPYEPVQATER